MRVWGPLRNFLGGLGEGISVLFSRHGLVSWGFGLLVFSCIPFLKGWIPGWIRTPFGGTQSAWDLSIIPSEIRLDVPERQLVSFGGALIGIVLFSIITRYLERWLPERWGEMFRWRGFHATMGLLALSVVLWYILVATYVRPEFVQDLLQQTAEMDRMKQFDNAYIKGNIGVVRLPDVSDDTLGDQVSALLAFIGMGYWYAIAGSACLFLGGLVRYRQEAADGDPTPGATFFQKVPVPLLSAGSLTAILLLFGTVLTGQSLLADHLMRRADSWAAEGNYTRAFELYRQARNIDHRLAINGPFVRKMGRAAYRIGDRDAPEARYFLSQQYRWDYDYANAEHHLRQAIRTLEQSGRTRTIPAYERYLEEVLTRWGRSLYDKGQYQGAVDRWLGARILDPDSYELPYYLSHAYFRTDGTDQARTIRLNMELLDRVRDRILRSDLYCNLGDAYYRQAQSGVARLYYERSLDMYNFVKDINYRAQKGMLGLGHENAGNS